MVKKQIIDVLKSVDVKYLPYDLHSKYYLLCYALSYKPKITFMNNAHNPDAQHGDPNNLMRDPQARPMSFSLIKQKWNGHVENAVLWLYRNYLYHILLAIIIVLIFMYPSYVLVTMIIAAV